MVIIGHFIDANWRLQKRILNFVYLPPSRHGVDILFSISMDNIAYNDGCLRILKDNFSRTKKLVGGKIISY